MKAPAFTDANQTSKLMTFIISISILSCYGFIKYKIRELTVPLKCKLPPSRETHLVSLETCLVSLETSLVSLEKFLVSRECTASTNALPLGECTNGIIRSNGRTHGKRTDNKRLDKPFETSVERLNGCNIFSNGKVERVNRCQMFSHVMFEKHDVG